MLGFLKLTNNEEFQKIKKMCYRNALRDVKNCGGQALEMLIKKICSDCDIPPIGPYQISTVLPKISEKLNIQIHLISSMDGTYPGVLSFPNGHDLKRPRVYLLCYTENHVVFIDSLKTFFERNGKVICFSCLKFLSTSWRTANVIQNHRCFKQLSCFNCNGLIESEETVKVENETTVFCDSHIKSKQMVNLNCTKCNLTFESLVCFQNHERLCESNHGGWRCTKCNVFQKLSNKSIEDIKQSHICGELRKKCAFCFQLKGNEHICKIKLQTAHDIWPNLCFLHMKFTHLGTGNCNNCFEIRSNYASKNNLTLPQLFKSEMFSQLNCKQHQNISNNPKPNLICLFKEEKRYFFSQYLFSDDDLFIEDSLSDRTFHYSYSEIFKQMSDIPFKVKKKAQKVSETFQKKLQEQCNTVSKTAVSKLLLFICDSKFSNYTFLTPEKNMVIDFFN